MNHHNVTLHTVAPMRLVASSWHTVEAAIEVCALNLAETLAQETFLSFTDMNGPTTFAIVKHPGVAHSGGFHGDILFL